MDEFLDPQVAELRERLVRALEAGGHTIVADRRRYGLPVSADVVDGSAIVGNLQSIDSDGREYAYYIRPAGLIPVIPDWLSAFIRASYNANQRPEVLLVVEHTDSELLVDAEACGAGVVQLTEEDTLNQVLPPAPPNVQLTREEFAREVEAARRAIISSSTLRERRLLDRCTEVTNIAMGAGPASQAQIDALERRYRESLEVRADLEQKLHVAELNGDVDAVRAVRDEAG